MTKTGPTFQQRFIPQALGGRLRAFIGFIIQMIFVAFCTKTPKIIQVQVNVFISFHCVDKNKDEKKCYKQRLSLRKNDNTQDK